MITYRFAEPHDIPVILELVRALAAYEHMEDAVVATPQLYREWLFEKKTARVLLAFDGDTAVGFALFFYNFSTWLGRAGIYLEDLFVLPEFRGKGYGKALLRELARITAERGCGRLEWYCLDWNKPSIDFYTNLGAVGLTDWTTYRLAGETLEKMARGE